MRIFLILLVLVPLVAVAKPVTLADVEAAVAKLEKMTGDEMKATGIPGIAVAVVYQDEVVFAKGFGVRELGKPAAVDADTVFPVASISKPIGSSVVAAVVGEGKISWDSKINDLDPEFAMPEPWVTSQITVRDFYAHRSGLPAHSGDHLEDIGFSRDEVLHRLRYETPSSSFRSAYAYTNFGMTEAAVAVARSTGKSWEELSDEVLYRPLGMTSTSSRHSDFLARANRVVGHSLVDGKWGHRVQREPDAQTPAAGVTSSVKDLTKWMRMQLKGGVFDGKPVVAEAPLAETHHPVILTGFRRDNGLPLFYGLGWNVAYDAEGRLRLSHSGAFELGAAAAVYLVPAEELGVVVVTNASPIGLPEALCSSFLDEALYGKLTNDWLGIFKGAFAAISAADTAHIADYTHPPESPVAAAPNSAYTGTYTNTFFGDAVVSEADGELFLGLGPQGRKYPLKHWNRDVFTYETAQEMFAGTSGIFFTMGPDGRAVSALVENLNFRGHGTFPRKAE